MGDHIEEMAFLSALLTQIAVRIEALKLGKQTEALRAHIAKLDGELATLKEAKE
jgi:hypothetical protein